MIGEISEEHLYFKSLGGVFALAAACVGLMAIFGMTFGPSFLASFGSGNIPMAPSTALFFILYGFVLFIRTYFPINRMVHRTGLTINAAGAVLALLLLFLSYHKIYLDIEKMGIPVSGVVAGAPVGHMSPLTAFCFLLASLSFLASFLKCSHLTMQKIVSFWAAGFLSATSMALLLAYLSGLPLLYGSSFIPPAATTSLAFLFLGIALLVAAVSREQSLTEPDRKELHFSFLLSLFYVVLAVGIIAAGYFYYRIHEKHHLAEVESQLSAIADLKVRDLVQWRKERLGDAHVYYKNDNFTGMVGRYLENPQGSDAKNRLNTWLYKLRAAYNYDRVLFMDARGKIRMSDPELPELNAPHLARDAAKALDSGNVTFLDFHRDFPDSPFFLAVLVPIIDQQNGGQPLGVLVLRINPETYLYPFIQSWPVASRSAETLIVRREGEYVVFLNALRFRKKTALNLKFSLNKRKDLPAAMAVKGVQGIVEGLDYRNVPVLAGVRAVPDSPWFLVARRDLSEIYAPLRERLWIIIILVGSLLVGTGAGTGLVWRHRRSRFFQERYESAETLRQSEARYRNTLDSMLEGCQIIGFDWQYLYVNDETIRQSRRTREELLGQKIMEVYPDITSTKMFAALKRCMDDRIPSTMENEFVYPDGQKAWFFLSIQPVAEGIFILSVDITEQKQAEKREKHLNAVIRAIRKVNQLITKEKDRERLISGACENLVATRGFSSAWIMLMDSFGKVVHLAESGLGESYKGLKELVGRGNLPQCVRQAMTRDDVVITTDTSVDCPDCPLESICEGNSSFCVKLKHNGKLYGTLTASVPYRFAFDEEEQTLFHEVGEDIAFGLHNIEQEEKKRQMVTELSHSEARYKALFEGAGEGILIADIENKEFKYANPAICQMLGYSEDELKSMGVRDIHPEADHERVISVFETQAKEGKGLAENIPCLRKDGTIFYADFNRTRTLIDGIACNVAFVTDVTERKEFNDALRESNERFRMLFEYAPDAYYLLDLEGRFIDVNRAAEKLTGYDKKEFIGRSFSEMPLLSSESLQKAVTLLQKNVQGFGTGPDELTISRKDGKPVFIEIRTFPLAISGQDMVLGIARDITERKSLEQQLQQSQKLEAVGRLSGGIAHDFNNLLTTVIGNAELMLLNIPKDDPLWDEIEEIKGAGERAASLTRQLLAFSRKQIFQNEVFNLNDTVQDIGKMLRRMIGEDIELKTRLAPELGLIEADVGQIEQLIMNLVVNARDAMPEGGKLTIETANVELDEEYSQSHLAVTSGPYVMLSVSDTGVGISSEIKDQIFEPFFTTKEKGKGTGLGLSTVYGIVKQSSGNIWVYSEPGQGTTFKIYLPRVDKPKTFGRDETRPSNKRGGPLEGHAPPWPKTRSETILVVEDDDQVRKFAVRVLKGYGYNVLMAENGEEAIEVSGKHQGAIDMVLTDVIMPGMSSQDMEKALRSHRPELKVLYMSGYTDNAIVHHGVLDPGRAFLGKPFTPESLGRKVRDVLDGGGCFQL